MAFLISFTSVRLKVSPQIFPLLQTSEEARRYGFTVESCWHIQNHLINYQRKTAILLLISRLVYQASETVSQLLFDDSPIFELPPFPP